MLFKEFNNINRIFCDHHNRLLVKSIFYTDDVLYQKLHSLLKNKILHTTMSFDYLSTQRSYKIGWESPNSLI